MRVQYIIAEEEIKELKKRLGRIRESALITRDAGDMDASREFYFKAKGFEEALTMLGILKKEDRQ